MDNCKTCLYANFNNDGSAMCDKRLLSDDIEFYVPANKVELPCPCHSNRPILETRYMRDNTYIHECEEGNYCDICRRKVNLDNESQYEYIVEVDDEGNIIIKLCCRICREKKRI